ncbi:magnesium transporter, partial [Phenoliferia sp. Uapishka_3]
MRKPSVEWRTRDKVRVASMSAMRPAINLTSSADLMGWWHKAARKVSPGDLTWEGRDHLGAKCTILRADGSVEKPETPFSKQSMIEDYGLQPRDLKSLDAHILDVRPSLLVCKRSIVLCTPIARAVITHDKVILLGSDSTNPLVSEAETDELVESLVKVMTYLDTVAKISAGTGGPGSKGNFEFRALEAFLILTIKGFKVVSEDLHDRVYAIIPQLRFGVSPAELRDLLESKRTIEDCLYSGRALQSAISDILGEDEDLVGMYLTDKQKTLTSGAAPRDIEDHQTAELLLEYYERRLDETNEGAVRLASLLDDIDSNITLVLASTRVRLQNLELQTAISTMVRVKLYYPAKLGKLNGFET